MQGYKIVKVANRNYRMYTGPKLFDNVDGGSGNNASASGSSMEYEDEPTQGEPSVVIGESSNNKQSSSSSGIAEDELEELINEEETKESFTLNNGFYKFLIGQQGRTLARLQSESRTVITIPGKQATSEEITITGTPSAIKKAKEAIFQIVRQSIHKLDYTHFLCIPLNTEETKTLITHHLIPMIDNCGKELKVDGYNKDLFQVPPRPHFTLAMLRLYLAEDVETLKKFMAGPLQDKLSALFSEEDVIRFSNLKAKCQNGDLTQTYSIFFEVAAGEMKDKIIELVNYIKKQLSNLGLITSEAMKQPFELHATLMGAKFRVSQAPFDSTEIIGRFGKHELLSKFQIPMRSIELSKREVDRETDFYKKEYDILVQQ